MQQDDENFLPPLPKRTPWNKGKLIGPKPPLRQKHVWSIRTKLQIEQRTREWRRMTRDIADIFFCAESSSHQRGWQSSWTVRSTI
jgi:hypothetical protein